MSQYENRHTVVLTQEDIPEHGKVTLTTPVENVRGIHCNRFRFLHDEMTIPEDLSYRAMVSVLFPGDDYPEVYSTDPFTIPKGFYVLPPPGEDMTWEHPSGVNFLATLREKWNEVTDNIHITHMGIDKLTHQLYYSYTWDSLYYINPGDMLFDIQYQIVTIDRNGNETPARVHWLGESEKQPLDNENVLRLFNFSELEDAPIFFYHSFDRASDLATLTYQVPNFSIPTLPMEDFLYVSLREFETNGVIVQHQNERGMENIFLTMPLSGMSAGWIEKDYPLDEVIYFRKPKSIHAIDIAVLYGKSRREITRTGHWTIELMLIT